VIEVDASEVIKAEGAVTCCSLVFEGDDERRRTRSSSQGVPPRSPSCHRPAGELRGPLLGSALYRL
jgi:hypothetical protein